MKKMLSLLLALALILALCAPAMAAKTDISYFDLSDEEMEAVIMEMLNDCIIRGVFSEDSQSVSRAATFQYSSEELYRSGWKTFDRTLRILVNRAELTQTPESYDALMRVVPFQHDPILELKGGGRMPGHHWHFEMLRGHGSTGGGTDHDGTTDYQIWLTVTLQRSEGDFIDQLKQIAAEVRQASDTVSGQLNYINQYLINRFSYDYDALRMGIVNNSVDNFLAWGKGVCGSYANTVNYLCFLLGIPCIGLESHPEGMLSHGWNCVYVDGAWKMLDVSGNDTSGNSRAYFLVDSINDISHDWQNYDDTEIVRCAKEKAIAMAAKVAEMMTPQTAPAPGVSVSVNGTPVAWTDAEPFIDENSRTMVPLRAVAEALGLSVSWDGAKREAIFTNGAKTIYFPIGSSAARSGDGGTVQMDTAAVIVNDRTYAPIRYLAEFFGLAVGWDDGTKTVLIDGEAASGGDSDALLAEALSAYKAFTAQTYHEDEWSYTIDSFGLFDLNRDGIPELFTRGGGQMDYEKVFTYRNGAVEYVHWGSGFTLFNNGVLLTSFSGGDGCSLYSYYAMRDDLSLELLFRYAAWFSIMGPSYSVGENAHDEDAPKVPYDQIDEQREKLLVGAKSVGDLFHENTAAERDAVFSV